MRSVPEGACAHADGRDAIFLLPLHMVLMGVTLTGTPCPSCGTALAVKEGIHNISWHIL
jgi:uncharacterized Zn finger protein (UPF0148 family)